MFEFLRQVGNYAQETFRAAKYIGQGLSVTFDHLNRRPVTVQYPYEKVIPAERYRGRIHFEFDKCISCEVCVRVCPINLPVVDWEFDKTAKKKKLNHYSIDFGVCIFCGNCVEYCPTNCLSMTEEYELSTYDRHELNYDNEALGRLPYKVTQDPMVTPVRELAYLPKGAIDGHDMPAGTQRAGQRAEEILAQIQQEQAEAEPAEAANGQARDNA
ncbi:MAG: NAD(P)H-quinone oxidoreductase subunit I [Cyanobacteria bacterium QS_8_64_29]|nr:MAG: NAD(P)H-quinone oxidoreductase subunit I [Cyanobacteria bacterium QS_8_64_29]